LANLWRTWEFANKLIDGVSNLKDHSHLLAGTLSEGVAREFIAYTEMMTSLPNINQIIKDPKNLPIDNDPALLYAVSHMVSAKIDDTNIEPLMDYLERLPIEFMTISVKAAIKRNADIFDLPRIKSWMNKLADEIFT
jgi:hypothetical protein